MAELSREDVQALGRAVGLEVQEPELMQVVHSLNAILEMMEEVDVPGMHAVEPLPVNLDDGEARHGSE